MASPLFHIFTRYQHDGLRRTDAIEVILLSPTEGEKILGLFFEPVWANVFARASERAIRDLGRAAAVAGEAAPAAASLTDHPTNPQGN